MGWRTLVVLIFFVMRKAGRPQKKRGGKEIHNTENQSKEMIILCTVETVQNK